MFPLAQRCDSAGGLIAARALPYSRAMTAHFHQKLGDLRRLLLGMGGLVEDQLRRATQALLEADRGRAQHAIALDPDVDALENRVDEVCVQLLALHQPAAADLRFVAGAMKVVTELERIGDQAVNLARCALEVRSESPDIGLRRMSAMARGLVSDSLDALARGDSALARRVIAGDAALDALEEDTVRRLLSGVAHDPARLRAAFRLAYAARCLERVGDHATNIAEMAVYVAEGVVERHRATALRDARAARRPLPAPLQH
jgi:phosphate transport system protein